MDFRFQDRRVFGFWKLGPRFMNSLRPTPARLSAFQVLERYVTYVLTVTPRRVSHLRYVKAGL